MLERIEQNPAELARRRARAERICQRPVRPWCIAIRASDTRIDEWGLNWSVNDDAQSGRPHTVEVTQWDLRDLTAPVRLGPWPGVRAIEAARALGRSSGVIRKWVLRGGGGGARRPKAAPATPPEGAQPSGSVRPVA